MNIALVATSRPTADSMSTSATRDFTELEYAESPLLIIMKVLGCATEVGSLQDKRMQGTVEQDGCQLFC